MTSQQTLPSFLDNAFRAMRGVHGFWTAQSQLSWPSDWPGYVFLGRAVHPVGRLLFGAAWTGDEFSTPLPPSVVATDLTKLSTHQQIHHLLKTYRPDVELPPFERLTMGHSGVPYALHSDNRHGWGGELSPVLLTPQHLTLALAAIAEEQARVAPLLERRFAVEREIARGCVSGELVSCYLKEGRAEPISGEHWNFQGWGYRFEACEYDPQRPWLAPASGQGRPIFLTDQSLRALTHAPGPKPAWHPEPGANQLHWATSPPAVAEAERRGAGPTASGRKRSGVLTTMWREAGLECGDDSFRQALMKDHKAQTDLKGRKAG